MKVYEQDLILSREFQGALDTGPPRPSWAEIEARAVGLAPRWQRGRLHVVLACAVVLLVVAIPALAFTAHSVFFKSAPHPFQSAIDAFARIGGPPGTPANTPAVLSQPRRVLTLSLSSGATAALWVAPTVDSTVVPWFAPATHHNDYCFLTQVVNGDPNAVGTGLAWGYGLSYSPGCGMHERALDIGYDVGNLARMGYSSGSVSELSSSTFLVMGGSGLRTAGAVEVRYENGSSTKAPTVYVTSPVDATFFMLEIPYVHIKRGLRPKELILRARDGSILARDGEVFSRLWRSFDNPMLRGGGAGSTANRPNSPRYQEREPNYRGAGAGFSTAS